MSHFSAKKQIRGWSSALVMLARYNPLWEMGCIHLSRHWRALRLIRQSKLARNFGNISRRSTESLLMVRLPQFDFVAVGIVYPGEAAVAFVLALRVDVDAFFR